MKTLASQYPAVLSKPSSCGGQTCYYGLDRARLNYLGGSERLVGNLTKTGHSYCHVFPTPEEVDMAQEPAREGFWSNEQPLPNIGDRVRINFNDFGEGTVVGYFFEADFIGVEVVVDKRPDWHVKQIKGDKINPLVFGAEVTVL